MAAFRRGALIETPKRAPRSSRSPRRTEARSTWQSLVLTSLADAAISTDSRGRIATMNPAAERLTGYSSASSIGRLHEDVFRLRDPGTKESVESPIRAILAGSGVVPLDDRSVLVREDEQERFIEGLAAPMMEGGAERVGVVVTFREAAGERRARGEAEKQLEAAREALRLHELFATMLGHDLRGPLGSILMSAQLILRRGDGDAAATVKRIQHSGHRMGRMVEQLLDFTRLRSNTRLPIHPGPMNLGTCIHRLLDDLNERYGKRTVVVDLAGNLDGEWDPDRVGQVMATLVGNAFQHGEPKSAVTVRGDGSSPDFVVLSVSNLGSVPEDMLTVLFDPFERVQKPGVGTEGLGIGLFISREIVHCHGGKLTASSHDGRTQMTVRLPRKCAAISPRA